MIFTLEERDGISPGSKFIETKRADRPASAISASEVASWEFCPEAWRLEYGLNLKSGNARERAAGERHHTVKSLVERVAGGSIALGRVLIVLAALVAAFLVFRWG